MTLVHIPTNIIVIVLLSVDLSESVLMTVATLILAIATIFQLLLDRYVLTRKCGSIARPDQRSYYLRSKCIDLIFRLLWEKLGSISEKIEPISILLEIMNLISKIWLLTHNLFRLNAYAKYNRSELDLFFHWSWNDRFRFRWIQSFRIDLDLYFQDQ